MADLIVDALLTATWCFPDERTDYTNGVLQALAVSVEVMAPRLWAYEIRNCVLMGIRRGRITQAHAETFLSFLKSLPIRLTDQISYDAVFKLADQHRLILYSGKDEEQLFELLPRASAFTLHRI